MPQPTTKSTRVQPTLVLTTGLAVGLGLLVTGLLVGRVDVLIVGGGLLAITSWDLTRAARGSLRVWTSLRGHRPKALAAPVELADHKRPGVNTHHVATGDMEQLAPTVGVEGFGGELVLRTPHGMDTVRLRLQRVGADPLELMVSATGLRQIPFTVNTVRTGPQDLMAVWAQGTTGSALLGPATMIAPQEVVVLPRPSLLPGVPLPGKLRGLSGAHPSRRPGEGSQLRDVHPAAPGQPLRRINWRATARRDPELNTLYARRTLADAEAVVALVVDSRDDLSPDPSTWTGGRAVRADQPTSLDVARIAASSIAEAYIDRGDRVGLTDLAARRRSLPPGAGRRHLNRLVYELTLTKPVGTSQGLKRAPVLPAGSIVYVLSTFLDADAADAALQWRRFGHRVVAVDVLPPLVSGGMNSRSQIAFRVVRMRRQDRLWLLARSGVEVVRWYESSGAEGDYPGSELTPQAALNAYGRVRARGN